MKKYILPLLAGLILTGCNFLEVEPKIITADTYYNSTDEVYYGLMGVYGPINLEAFYGSSYSIFLSNCDDLCYFNRETTTSYTAQYAHDASATEIYSAWTAIYKGIGNANSLMEAIYDSEYDEDHSYYNEARFLRAFYYFILAQAWGDVPLRTEAAKTPSAVTCPATSQYEVLKWAVAEMEDCLELASETWESASRVTKTTMQGIIARVYLFMAGETVSGNESYRAEYYGKALDAAAEVINSGLHSLNPSYQQVFINMISDVYDTEYKESMWEADFLGERESSDSWSNGRIGDLLGLQCSASSNFTEVLCNYAYGQFNGSLKLWNLYWRDDRTADETELSDVTDERQYWNMRPYNYNSSNYAPYPETGSGSVTAGMGKASYVYNGTTAADPTTARAIRNCGKWSREVEYEGCVGYNNLYTPINFPILRYSDVLLMYAEAVNEYYGAPTAEAYDCVKQVRDRAGISTADFGEYSDYDSFQSLVRNERARELAFEGLRKYDLIRWGIFVESMQDYLTDTQDEQWSKNVRADYAYKIGSNVKDCHIVLPIPSIELGVNTELVQNPLW